MKQLTITYPRLKELSSSVGLDLLGLTDAALLENAAERTALWQRSGCAADMGFMKRDALLLASPAQLLPETRSIVVFGVPYDCSQPGPIKEGFGRVARYAWGRDYHIVLKDALEKLLLIVKPELSAKLSYRIFVDAVPLLERALGERAGLGFAGRNTMLINKAFGSYFFLAELFWNVELSDYAPECVERCPEKCAKCLHTCPSQALKSEFLLDSRRCISYLTIEKRGAFDKAQRQSLGEWVFGCDECQDCCPFNQRLLRAGQKLNMQALSKEKGPGPFLDLGRVLSIRDNAEFKKIFSSTALMRTKREGLLRNAAAVAANTKAGVLCKTLEQAFREDPSPVLRLSALSALVDLQENGAGLSVQATRNFIDQGCRDIDEIVREGARRLFA